MQSVTLHPLLGIDKSNPLFEILFDPEVPDKLLVHFGMKFLEAVPRNSFAEKLLIARLFNAGFNRKKLRKTFRYDFKTMQRWGELLKDGDWETIKRIADGSGAKKKITEEKLSYILDLFDRHYHEKRCHIISYIVKRYSDFYKESISCESIRNILKEQRIESNIHYSKSIEQEYPLILYFSEAQMHEKISNLFDAVTLSRKTVHAKTVEDICENSNNASKEICKKSKYPPISKVSDDKIFPMIDSVFKEILSCHHIGILLTRIFMDFISEDIGSIYNIIRQWLAMILSGCYNIEQGRGLNYRALELFVGEQKASPDKQRIILKDIATANNITKLFSRNIRMLKAENEDTFMLDPHGVPYTGQLPILKCWLGGSHSTGKGYYLDLIHTLKGEPIFSVIDDNYYDLRQRFLADIKGLRNILDGDKKRFLTIIVDRAIYDVEFMKRMVIENIYIITWEKNYSKGQWEMSSNYPVETFSIMKYRNRKEDSYLYKVQFFKRPWGKEKSFAQFIILLSKPGKISVELSIICTDFSRESQESIKPILTRWLQENDIGYLISLGINQITSYSYHTYDEIAESLTDRNIANREFTKMATEKLKLKKELGILLVNREFYIEKKEQDLIHLGKNKMLCEKKLEDKNLSDKQIYSLNKKLKKVNTKIKRLPLDRDKALNNNLIKQKPIREKLKELDEKLNLIPKGISRIDNLIREEYVKLNFMPKSLMDAVKITARNIIYQLLEIFRPIWNNYRNDLVILRELITAMGHIEETQTTIIVRLNPIRQFSKGEKVKIALFLFKISNRINKQYNLKKTVIISLYEL